VTATFADRGRACVAELATTRPHLARRRPSGDVDQDTRTKPESVDLAGDAAGSQLTRRAGNLSSTLVR